MQELTDRYGRRFPYLRLSITDVCNFKCQYCLPKGYQKTQKTSFLSLDEIRHLVLGFAGVGTTKVRLTGGEPTLRSDFFDIVAMLKVIPEIRKLVLTTNGYKLSQRAQDYIQAGIQAINISIDSLNPEVFAKVTGKPWLKEILQGIDALLEGGMPTVKLNTVLLKDLTVDHLGDFFAFIKNTPLTVRFIELMQTGEHQAFFHNHHVGSESLKTSLLQQGWVEQIRSPDSGPAIEYIHPDFLGKIGIIAPYSKDFCATCNRLRVTAQGELRLCLFANSGYSLRSLLQSPDQQNELKATLKRLLNLKEKSHSLHRGDSGLTPHLASIGG